MVIVVLFASYAFDYKVSRGSAVSMDTQSDRLVIDGTIITEGTSLFLTRTDEVAWITDIQDDLLHIETITDSFTIHEDRLVEQIFETDVIVESSPSGQPRIPY